MDKTPFAFLVLLIIFAAANLTGQFTVADASPNKIDYKGFESVDALLKEYTCLKKVEGLVETEYGLKINQKAIFHLDSCTSEQIRLSFQAESPSQDSNFTLLVGDEVIDKHSVNLKEQYTSPTIELGPDAELVTIKGSAYVSEIQLFPGKQFKDRFVYGKNWYPLERYYPQSSPQFNFAWLAQDGVVYYFNGGNKRRVRGRVGLRSFRQPRNLSLYVNGRFLQTIKVNNTLTAGEEIYLTRTFSLEPGSNNLTFSVSPGCIVADKVNQAEDRRCLSLTLDSLSLKKSY